MKIIKNFYEFAHKFEFKENFIFLDLITIEPIGEVFTKSFILDKDLKIYSQVNSRKLLSGKTEKYEPSNGFCMQEY